MFNLREARFSAKLTQQKISDATGIHPADILAHETGAKKLSGVQLRIVQDFVAKEQAKVDALMRGEELEGEDDDD